MIREFIESWHLFAVNYSVGWLAAAMLGLIGVIVVARDQVFLGAAVAQASTLGVALAMWAGAALHSVAPAWVESSPFLTATAIVSSVAAALVSTRAGGQGRESREAVTGWLYLLGGAGSVVVVANSPHGEEEVRRLFSSSSLLGATRGDLVELAVLLAAMCAVVVLWWRPILLWVMDPVMASATGVRVRALQLGLAAGLGVGIGLSIRVSGLLYTFGCLVLPALIAKNLAREVRTMFVLAPLIAVGVAVVGFVVANDRRVDVPPGQMTVTLLALLLPVAWAVRKRVFR